LCTYGSPIDRAGVGVGETVGQHGRLLGVAQLLQRDVEFRLQSPWLAGVKSKESWKWGQFGSLPKDPTRHGWYVLGTWTKSRAKSLVMGSVLLVHWTDRCTSHPLFAKAFSTHNPILFLLGEVFFDTPEAVKRRAAGQGQRIVSEALER
jgi:hypothetical protein